MAGSDLDDKVMWTLIRVAHHVELQLTALFAEHSLSPVQFGVLSQLSAQRSLTIAVLARECLVRPQTMAGVVEGMEARDLVVREGARGRGRRSLISLTERGQSVLEAAWPGFVRATSRRPSVSTRTTCADSTRCCTSYGASAPRETGTCCFSVTGSCKIGA